MRKVSLMPNKLISNDLVMACILLHHSLTAYLERDFAICSITVERGIHFSVLVDERRFARYKNFVLREL